MKVEWHIYVSLCTVLTSMLDKHFQYIHIKTVNSNIKISTLSINQNHLSILYLHHPITYLTSAAILFARCQLDIVHTFYYLKTLQIWMLCIQLYFFCKYKYTGIIKSVIGGMISHL